jgi:hypothetical protein
MMGSDDPGMRATVFAWSTAMKRNCYLMSDGRDDRSVRVDLSACEGLAIDHENLFAWGARARRETECFLNGHIRDGSKGWPVLSAPRRIVA